VFVKGGCFQKQLPFFVAKKCETESEEIEKFFAGYKYMLSR